jgi:transcriptional regulator with XRE-family HTH domain
LNFSTIRRYEEGEYTPSPERVAALLEGYGVSLDGPTAKGLLALARSIQALAKGAAPPLGPPLFAALIELEQSAIALRIYEPTLIPVFAQTEDYARALFTLRHTEPEVSERVRTRLMRQRDILETRRIPVDLLISEAALRYVVGGPRVWRGQLKRLLEIEEMRQVTVRVVPFAAGAAAAMATSCHTLEYEGELPTVIYFETRHSEGFVEQPDEVRKWEQDFDALWNIAWTPAQTREAITAIIS